MKNITCVLVPIFDAVAYNTIELVKWFPKKSYVITGFDDYTIMSDVRIPEDDEHIFYNALIEFGNIENVGDETDWDIEDVEFTVLKKTKESGKFKLEFKSTGSVYEVSVLDKNKLFKILD